MYRSRYGLIDHQREAAINTDSVDGSVTAVTFPSHGHIDVISYRRGFDDVSIIICTRVLAVGETNKQI